MRRRCRRLIPALLLAVLGLFVLTGCTSFSAILKSNFSGLPIWYFDPEVNTGKNNTGMVGEGHASTERQAELLAYSDIIEQLSIATGSDLGQEARTSAPDTADDTKVPFLVIDTVHEADEDLGFTTAIVMLSRSSTTTS